MQRSVLIQNLKYLPLLHLGFFKKLFLKCPNAFTNHCLKFGILDRLVAFKCFYTDRNNLCEIFLSDTCLAKHLSSYVAPDIFNRSLIQNQVKTWTFYVFWNGSQRFKHMLNSVVAELPPICKR